MNCARCGKDVKHIFNTLCIECSNKLFKERENKIPFDWEEIKDDTWRAKVFGGWIVQTICWNGRLVEAQIAGTSLCFIPDPSHEWEIK